MKPYLGVQVVRLLSIEVVKFITFVKFSYVTPVERSWQKVSEVPDIPLHAKTDLSSSTPSDSPNEMMYEPSESIQVVNQCLVDLGETPVTKRKMYSERKHEVLTMMKVRYCNNSKRNFTLLHKIVRKYGS